MYESFFVLFMIHRDIKNYILPLWSIVIQYDFDAMVNNVTIRHFLFFLSRQVRLFYISRLSCCSLLCLWSCWWIDINLWTASSLDVRIRKEAKNSEWLLSNYSMLLCYMYLFSCNFILHSASLKSHEIRSYIGKTKAYPKSVSSFINFIFFHTWLKD